MKRVGILGGTGAIGRGVVKLLKDEYPILASYRTNKKESTANCQYLRVDVSDKDELRKFCSQCRVIVNCAGASYINGETVARIASEYHIPYIDPSGETFLEERIDDIRQDNVFVLSSGYFPGMTGFLMNYLCKSLDVAEEVLGLSVSEEIPSKSAIEDFILTNLSGFGIPLNYYDHGVIKRDEKEIFEIIKNKEYALQNYLTVETQKIAKKFSLKQANWYNPSLGEEVTKKMQEAVIKFKLADFKGQYDDVVDEIRKIFINNANKDRQFSYTRIDVKGLKGDKRIFKRAEISSYCSSEISAIVAAYTVKAVLNSNRDKGIYYAMDVINPEQLIKDLSKLDVDFNINERDVLDGEYEEGEL